jgi:hypothetical protein
MIFLEMFLFSKNEGLIHFDYFDVKLFFLLLRKKLLIQLLLHLLPYTVVSLHCGRPQTPSSPSIFNNL